MTRIIGGAARGRRIAVPAGRGTRPTSDRAREGLFSTLESMLPAGLGGSRVLDLYAGSGAIGLEALSRGAGHACLVEADAKAARVVRDNARLLGFGVEVLAMRAERVVAAPALTPYDVVFLDPPYATTAVEVHEVLAALLAQGWTAPDGVVVVERPVREQDWVWPQGLAEDRERTYGDTVLRYARRS